MSIAYERLPEVIGTEDEDPIYPITADQFFEMIEAGVFPAQARVYLHDGRIREKMAKTRAHSVIAGMIHEALNGRLPGGWKIFFEGEFKLDHTNAGLPDLAVVRGESFRGFLTPEHEARGDEIGLAVEVAVTSLTKDLGSNMRRHAKAMIPAYWVADFHGRRLHVHTGPRVVAGRGEYEHVEIISAGGTVPLVLDGREVARFAFEELMP